MQGGDCLSAIFETSHLPDAGTALGNQRKGIDAFTNRKDS